MGLDHWATSVVHLSSEGSLWSISYLFSSSLAITLPSVKNKTALLSCNLMSGNCELQFPAAFQLFSRDCRSVLLILFLILSVVSRNLSMTCSVRIFLKIFISPQNHVFCVAQGQTSIYDRLAHTPRTQDRCPHRVSPPVSEPPACLSASQETVPVVIYRCLQQVLILSTPQISQSCIIVTLSQNSNQNLHPPAS